MRGLTRFAWATLVFNVAVILMGAVVRATGSGAGCGRSWPACQGRVVPELAGATAVEFTHRVLSGMALVMVAVLVIGVFRSVARGNPARPAAATAMGAIIGEALIGAVIVLFEWVAGDTSVARTISVPLHLLNTFLLLAALALTADWLGGGLPVSRRDDPARWRWVMAGGAALLVVAATGAVTALADTLFPKDGSGSVTAQHFLTDLRVVHPIVALTVVSVAWVVVRRRGLISREVNLMVVLIGLQVASGALSIALQVPLAMQLLHLALADLLWVAYVVTAARILAVEPSGTQASADLRASGSSTGASQTKPRQT